MCVIVCLWIGTCGYGLSCFKTETGCTDNVILVYCNNRLHVYLNTLIMILQKCQVPIAANYERHIIQGNVNAVSNKQHYFMIA